MNTTSGFLAVLLGALVGTTASTPATEYHVSTNGNDTARGTRAAPFRTLQHAADLAQPGDAITVHRGTYRERVNPPRGGSSESKRIVYQAAGGEQVEIKGSEVVTNWTQVQEGVWKAVLPNSFFGNFNPYKDLIRGDWFEPRGREHHTGAVYLNGEWLTEAAKLEEVLLPAGQSPAWVGQNQGVLLNVAWLKPVLVDQASQARRVPGTAFAAQQGTQNAPCTEGGECVGWIEAGDWLRYEGVDFGSGGSKQLEIRSASATAGGIIEVRADSPQGELLGSCKVPNTGGWQSWNSFFAPIKSVRGLKTICLTFRGSPSDAINPHLWYAKVDDDSTSIWAQFGAANPNQELVEINVRKTVFYPDQPGRDFITVRGFTMRHAATPWAPPTAEQVGLIGTHWSKGWIIENNIVSHSICSGIALGKHGDQYDNTSANTAEGYVKTIERAYEQGWTRDNIGHHVVRNNTISHCEQAGIVGSLGAAFCTVIGNTIHDVHVRRLFTGAEMAGIKFHAAIDSVIAGNHIHRTCLGLWLDWMAQGTRVSGNLFHDNAGQDLFVEVDHGPFVVDNNLFLSGVSLLDMSEGGAYVHNLFNGKIISRPEPGRETPYHPAHSTKMAGLTTIKGGDDRFYNNIFVGKGAPPAGTSRKDPEWAGDFGLAMYDHRDYPLFTGGNVFYNGAQPYGKEAADAVVSAHDPKVQLAQEGDRFVLSFEPGSELEKAQTVIVTTELLGKAKVPNVAYEAADGSPLTIACDYNGKMRSKSKPVPGPFETRKSGPQKLKLK